MGAIKTRSATALAVAVGAIGLAAPASALAAHGNQYHAESKGNGKCHDVGSEKNKDRSARGLGRASENDNSAVAPFSCEDRPEQS